MKRKVRSWRPEGEEGPLVKVLVIIGFVMLLAAGGGVAALYIAKKNEVAELDSTTFCPKSGATSVTSVLIDRTDGINPVQAEALEALIVTWVHQVPEHGAFRVYEVGGTGLSEPRVDVCNPGDVENVNVFTGNERMTRERYEAKFMAPIKAMIAGMLTDKEAKTSPIMEAVQSIAVQDFGAGRAKDERKLFIVSDLLQYTSELDLYKKPQPIGDFRKTVYGQKIESDLQGVKTWVYLLHSRSAKQTGDVVQFWLDWLMFQKADLQGQFKVPG
jgi:hypothetical protein